VATGAGVPKSFEARFVLAVLAYVCLQVLVRLWTGPSLELDEAEAFYQSRHLAWGYGPQPPLYFWLQWGLFRIFGPELFALALLKALILAVTVLGLFGLLRGEAGAMPAAVAALSLSLLPQVVWEGQRALTHSMLVLLMAVVAAGLFVRALGTGRWRDHLLLGAALGLGMLSKFNFALWPLGLLSAAVLLPECRGRLRPLRLLATLGVTAVVVAPVGLWMVRNPDLSTGSVRKLEMAPGGLAARLVGTGDLLMAALSFLGLALLVMGGFALNRRGGGTWPPVARLLATAGGMAMAVLWVGLLASGATEVAERWLLPMAWVIAPAGILWLWPGLDARGRRALVGTVAGLWLVVVPLLPYASLIDPGYRSADFGPLIERLRARGAGERPLEVESQWVAGNLAFHAPDLAPRLWRPDDVLAPGSVLVLQEALRSGQAASLVSTGGELVSIQRGNRSVTAVVTGVEG